MSLDLTMLVRRVADLARRLDEMPALRWGTVVTSSPLTVRLDGDTDATGGLESVTGALAAGTRVLVVRWNRRGVVLGSAARRGQVVVQSGVITGVSPLAADALGSYSATFPSPFAATPTIVATPTNNRYSVEVTALSAVEVTFTARNVSAANAVTISKIYWVAVGTA